VPFRAPALDARSHSRGRTQPANRKHDRPHGRGVMRRLVVILSAPRGGTAGWGKETVEWGGEGYTV